MKKSFSLVLLCLCSSILTVQAGDLERRQAKQIHDRLTGVPPSDETLDSMETALISDSSGKTAAEIALANPSFYNVTLKNLVTPWTNEDQTVFASLNDYTATVIGMVRDDVDFRKILYEDIIYTGNNSPAYSNSSNAHYTALEALGPEAGNLADPGILQQQLQSDITGLPTSATAGVITTRAAARAFFYLGTNRAMFRFTFMNHLCTDLDPIKDITRTPNYVHQDVSRSPGGDSRIYLNSCVGCHAGMDGMMGAFAHYSLEFDEDADNNVVPNTAYMIYTPEQVQEKFLINANNFNPGHITTDDSWINYWRNGQNALLGWGDYPGLQTDDKGNAVGSGAKALGMELANSNAFASCQVKKAFQAVCLRDPENLQSDRDQVSTITADFKSGGYKMKQVFRDVAAWCKGD